MPSRTVIIAFFILLGIIIYQEIQISELQWRVDYMYTYDEKESFTRRISDVEYDVDSHTSDVYKNKMKIKSLEKELHGINRSLNDLRWRLRMQEWE